MKKNLTYKETMMLGDKILTRQGQGDGSTGNRDEREGAKFGLSFESAQSMIWSPSGVQLPFEAKEEKRCDG